MFLIWCSRTADKCSDTSQPNAESWSGGHDACIRSIGSEPTEPATEYPATDEPWHVAAATVSPDERNLFSCWSCQSEHGQYDRSADAAADSRSVVDARFIDIDTKCQHSGHGHWHTNDSGAEPTHKGMAPERHPGSKKPSCSQTVSSCLFRNLEVYWNYCVSTVRGSNSLGAWNVDYYSITFNNSITFDNSIILYLISLKYFTYCCINASKRSVTFEFVYLFQASEICYFGIELRSTYSSNTIISQ